MRSNFFFTRVFDVSLGLAAMFVVCALGSTSLAAQPLLVTAPTHKPRLPEVLELRISDVRLHVPGFEQKTVVNAQTHEPLATQLYASSGAGAPDTLLIALQIPASGQMRLDFLDKKIASSAGPLVFGREAPERKDDFAWENFVTAYRVYGPALEAAGEITSGIDVWSKRGPALVIDRFYKHDAEGARTHNPALSYHKDDGIGLDSYEVGPSRGCGGTAVVSSGKLWVSKNYTHLKVHSTGPVRFEFEMTYAPWNADGLEVTETKHITLDAGTHLNKIQSTFAFAGSATVAAAAGLAIHAGADVKTLESGRILSVWDTPQDPSAGRIATGILAGPGQTEHTDRINAQALMIFKVHSGEPFTYYAGSGWSKADMPTQQSWDSYLASMLDQQQHPLQTSWVNQHATRRGAP